MWLRSRYNYGCLACKLLTKSAMPYPYITLNSHRQLAKGIGWCRGASRRGCGWTRAPCRPQGGPPRLLSRRVHAGSSRRGRRTQQRRGTGASSHGEHLRVVRHGGVQEIPLAPFVRVPGDCVGADHIQPGSRDLLTDYGQVRHGVQRHPDVRGPRKPSRGPRQPPDLVEFGHLRRLMRSSAPASLLRLLNGLAFAAGGAAPPLRP